MERELAKLGDEYGPKRCSSVTMAGINAVQELRQVKAFHCATIYNSSFMNLGLKDRVALVAASSQGIGRATAEAFAAEGCRLALCARNQEILQTAAEQIRKQHNVDVLAEAFDVTDAADVAAFVAAVAQRFGS